MTFDIRAAIAAIVWMGLIYILSDRPNPPAPSGIAGDVAAVLAHLFLFGVLAILIHRAFIGDNKGNLLSFVIIVWAVSIFGIYDEIHQSSVPGRVPSFFDVVVDTIGAILALLAWRWYLVRSGRAEDVWG